MAVGGAFLRTSHILLRVLELLCSIVVLGIFSYFLAVLKDHDLPISNWDRAVEGMSGAATLYLIFAVLLTWCRGGISFFAFLAVLLDICFIGCFAAIAWFNRQGAESCSGNVNTVLGSGPADFSAPGAPKLHRACQLETAVFAVSIINIFLFLVTALLQVALVRHHRREKRYGPSPANNYTAGSGRFWRRNRRGNRSTRSAHYTRDAEVAAVAAGGLAPGRHSHETGYTGTTMEAPLGGGANTLEHKYGLQHIGYITPDNSALGYSEPVHHVPVNGHRVTGTNY